MPGRRAVEPWKREPSTIILNPDSLRMKINETMTIVMHTQLPFPMHDAEMKNAVCLLKVE